MLRRELARIGRVMYVCAAPGPRARPVIPERFGVLKRAARAMVGRARHRLGMPKRPEAANIQMLWQLLASADAKNQWLLVLDDVKDPAVVQPHWTPLTANVGHVIVTSSKPPSEWPGAGANFTATIELEPWDNAVIRQFWQAATGDAPLPDPRLSALADHVGRTPLVWRILAGVASSLDAADADAIMSAALAPAPAASASGLSNTAAFSQLLGALRTRLDAGAGGEGPNAELESRLCCELLDLLAFMPVTGLSTPESAGGEQGSSARSWTRHAHGPPRGQCGHERRLAARCAGVPQKVFGRPEGFVTELQRADEKAQPFYGHYIKVGPRTRDGPRGSQSAHQARSHPLAASASPGGRACPWAWD